MCGIHFDKVAFAHPATAHASLARSRHARPRMAAVAVRAHHAADASPLFIRPWPPTGPGSARDEFQFPFPPPPFKFPPCIRLRFNSALHDSLVWRDGRAGVFGGALDGHPARPARKHFRRDNRRHRVLAHGWRNSRRTAPSMWRLIGKTSSPASRSGKFS